VSFIPIHCFLSFIYLFAIEVPRLIRRVGHFETTANKDIAVICIFGGHFLHVAQVGKGFPIGLGVFRKSFSAEENTVSHRVDRDEA
jgi:hypothetical protein